MRSPTLSLLISILGFSPGLAHAQTYGVIQAATTTPTPGVTGGAGSYAPSFSADGRFLVFISQANNLVTNDSNSDRLDVFVRDLNGGLTTLVSVSTNGTGGGDGNSFNPTISSNGQFIAFESTVSNLAPNDTNGASDVFVRDMLAGTTTLVSVNTNGTGSGSRRSFGPVISGDGRWVAFESLATNLVVGDNNLIPDVFARDTLLGTTVRASHNALSSVGNSRSDAPSISADGQRIAFASDANFGAAKPNSKGEVYVRDLSSGTTIWASTNVYYPNSAAGPAIRSFNPMLSVDGRYVAFKAASSSTNLYHHDLQTRLTTLIRSNVWWEGPPAMTPDGRFVAFESATNVFLWDTLTGTNLIVSVDTNGAGPVHGTSLRPALSQDASRIAFLSDANDVATNGGNGLFQLYARDLFLGTTHLVSATPDGKPGSDLAGSTPAISPDGNQVAFASPDKLVAPGDGNRDSDVFIYGVTNEALSLVSVRVDGLPSQTTAGYLLLAIGSLSANGDRVVLTTWNTALVEDDFNRMSHVVAHDSSTGTNIPVDLVFDPSTNALALTNLTARSPVISSNGQFVAYAGRVLPDLPLMDQVYRQDLQTGSNWLASATWDGGTNASGQSSAPSISGNGQLVAFQSEVSNLVPTDANGQADVFMHDFGNATNLLLSANRFETGSGNGPSLSPVISQDGRWVVFQSKATDLATNSYNSSVFHLFARNLESNVTTFVSIDDNGVGASGAVGTPIIDAAGPAVLFAAANNSVFLHDLNSRTNTPVCASCFNPSMSADRRWVVYRGKWGVASNHIILKDLHTGMTNLVSVNSNGTAGTNGLSSTPVISANGRYVVFASRAGDLVDNDGNGFGDIFIRDRILNITILASVNQYGISPGNSVSSKPILGPDGYTVVFQSFSADLVQNDFNNNRDIFVLHLSAGDSDADGMDDDWELAYFENLDRTGAGDFDSDGHTDLQEFLAGTDPTKSGSILRVLTLTSLNGDVTILWSATPGRQYRVQYRNNIEDVGWTELPGIVTATGSTASAVDDSGGVGGKRFYRVLLVL